VETPLLVPLPLSSPLVGCWSDCGGMAVVAAAGAAGLLLRLLEAAAIDWTWMDGGGGE
jgi:hypothetical protein